MRLKDLIGCDLSGYCVERWFFLEVTTEVNPHRPSSVGYFTDPELVTRVTEFYASHKQIVKVIEVFVLREVSSPNVFAALTLVEISPPVDEEWRTKLVQRPEG